MTCVGCEVRESGGAADVKALVAEQLTLELPENLVSPNLYEKRIKSCQSCSFASQDTCLKCGCFYAFRAHLKNKGCPANRWQQDKNEEKEVGS